MAHPRLKLSLMPGLKEEAVSALEMKGFTRLEHLQGQEESKLSRVKGIGKKAAAKLMSEVAHMNLDGR